MYNIHAQYLTDTQREELYQQLSRVRPSMIVVMDNEAFAHRCLSAVKNVVYRSSPIDFDNVHTQHTVQQWVENHAPFGNRFILYANNEPHTDEASFEWLLGVAKACVARGWDVALGNFSVGRPSYPEWQTPAAKKFLSYIQIHSDHCYLGLHEYFPSFWGYELMRDKRMDMHRSRWTNLYRWGGGTHLLGRYEHILMQYPRLKIAFTEFGTDSVDAAQDWQKDVPGWSPAFFGLNQHDDAYRGWAHSGQSAAMYYYDSLVEAYRTFYAPYRSRILGLAAYCYGGEGMWQRYDMARKPELLHLFEQDPFKEAPMPVKTIPKGPYTVPNGPGLNLRDRPGGNIVALLAPGALLSVTDGILEPQGSNDWVHVLVGGNTGYVAYLPTNPIKPYVPPNRDALIIAELRGAVESLSDLKARLLAIEQLLNS